MTNQKNITVDFDKTDYKWHAYCHDCLDNGQPLSVGVAHTADSVRLTQLVQGALKHVVEVHGA